MIVQSWAGSVEPMLPTFTVAGARPRLAPGRALGWELHSCSWRDSAPALVDAIIADPPYDEHTHQGHRLPVRDRAAVPFDPIDPADFIPELIERSSGWVVCFCSLEMFGAYKAAAGSAWVRSGLWVKPDACPQMSGDRPAVPAEGIAIMHRPGRKRWNGGGRKALWSHNRARGGERCHETPKPVSLMVELVNDFSQPGATIWDPFAGGGTTGVAAIRRGRAFIGHELRERTAAGAAARVARSARARAAARGLAALASSCVEPVAGVAA